MKSVTSRQFRELYSKLPDATRRGARQSYKLFRDNPAHPGLNFKKVEGHEGTYSARIGGHYRALGQLDGDTIIWFWIGSHAEYDKLV